MSAWSRTEFGLEVRDGQVPVVVYAPHAGRRRRPIRRGDAVNDLYTADVACILADALDAHALVNATIDRNDADLNRVSVLSSTAAPALGQLRALVERASAGGTVPLVLVVHGWNVSMPACDVGVGLRVRDGDVRGSYPTVSRATFERFVRGLIDGLRSNGIEAPLGLRYPASGRDNATQLFSGRHAAHEHTDVAALSRLAFAGRADAVQLELAIPLRWPGRHRERCLEAITTAVCRDITERLREPTVGEVRIVPRSEWARAAHGSRSPAAGARRPRLPHGWSVQAVLPDGSGLFGGAEPTGAGEAAARLCLVRADGRMLLFVGEDAWSGDACDFQVGGLRLQAFAPAAEDRAVDDHDDAGRAAAARVHEGSMAAARVHEGSMAAERVHEGSMAAARVQTGVSASSLPAGARIRLVYDGPMVMYPAHDAFCDLETGLAGSDVVAAVAQLEFEASNDGFGRLRGAVACGGERLDVDVIAVCERGSRRGATARARSRVFVTHGPASPVALCAHLDDDLSRIAGAREPTAPGAVDGALGSGAARSVSVSSRSSETRPRCECRLNGDGEVAVITCVLEDGRTSRGRVLTRVPVYRTLGDSMLVKVTFGTAALAADVDEAPSLALFEHVELV